MATDQTCMHGLMAKAPDQAAAAVLLLRCARDAVCKSTCRSGLIHESDMYPPQTVPGRAARRGVQRTASLWRLSRPLC